MQSFTKHFCIAATIAACAMSAGVAGAAETSGAGNLPDINAYVNGNSSGSSSSVWGVYRLPQNGDSEFYKLVEGPNVAMNGVCKDGLYYATFYQQVFIYEFITVEVYDMESRTKTASFSPSDKQSLPVGGLALDPSTGDVFGITYNSDKSGQQLSKLNYSTTEVSVTSVAALDGEWNSLSISPTGELYAISGVSGETKLCKIDRETGAVTEIGTTGISVSAASGSCIDPRSGRMFWAPVTSEGTSGLYEINLSTGEATELFPFPANNSLTGMYVPVAESDDIAPGECSDISCSFPEGALSGTVTLTTPTTLFDGSAPVGNMTVNILGNGEKLASAEAEYGSVITVPVTVAAEGIYEFEVYASNDAGDGPRKDLLGIYVGNDTPIATTPTLSFNNETSMATLTWLPVNSSVNGGYVDFEKLTYTVLDRNGETVQAGITGTEWSGLIEIPTGFAALRYSVTAECNGKESAPALSNELFVGTAPLPYEADFATDGFYGWTVVDSNNDGKIWNVEEDGSAAISYNTQLAMDDWLISPPVYLQKGNSYAVSFKANAHGEVHPERIEVKVGNSIQPDELTTVLVEPTVLTSKTPREFNALIIPQQDGIYHVGIHGISDADSYMLFVSDFIIQKGTSAAVPAAATRLEVVPEAHGKLSADISFTTPDKTVDGYDLTGLTKVVVSRNGEAVKTIDNPETNKLYMITDEVSADGNYDYSVVCWNNAGEGLIATASAYIGINLPEAPGEVTITRTGSEGDVKVSWEAPVHDVTGAILSPESLKYNLYVYDGQDSRLIEENISGTEFTFRAVGADEQKFVQCGVRAVTRTGTGEEEKSDAIPVGKPYNGLHESFADGKLGDYVWVTRQSSGNWTMYTDASNILSQDDDNGFIGFTGAYRGDTGDLVSGLVSLADDPSPSLTFYTYSFSSSQGADINSIIVSARTADENEYTEISNQTVDDICGDKLGWSQASVDMSAYAGKVVQIKFTTNTNLYSYTLFDNINLGVPASVKGIATDATRIVPGQGTITVTTPDTITVTIVDTAGAIIYTGEADGTVTIPVSPGIYIVKAGSTTAKTAVR